MQHPNTLKANKWNILLVVSMTLFLPAYLPTLAQTSTLKESSSTTAQQNSERLTEEEVRKAVKEIGEASERQDLEGVMNYIAPFAHSEITSISDSGAITQFAEGTAQHRRILAEALKRGKASQRKLLRETIQVKVAGDGTAAVATILATTSHSVQTPKPQRYFSLVDQTLRFGKVNGKVMIISSSTSSRISARPDAPKQ